MGNSAEGVANVFATGISKKEKFNRQAKIIANFLNLNDVLILKMDNDNLLQIGRHGYDDEYDENKYNRVIKDFIKDQPNILNDHRNSGGSKLDIIEGSLTYIFQSFHDEIGFVDYIILAKCKACSLSISQIDLCRSMIEEITERIADQHLILNLKENIVQLNANRQMLAHDIRGPLNGIIGLTELVRGDLSNNIMEDLPLYVTMINESGNSLVTLTEDILSSSGNADINDSSYSLKSFCNHLLKLFKPRLIRKTIRFKFQVTHEDRYISFPKDHTLEIAGNLISNAIKFTPEGGEINVRLGIKVVDDQKKLCIRVSDTGIGMDDKTLESIRNGLGEHTLDTSGERGYGLGLISVKKHIDSKGGTMQIHSAPGEGSVFEVILPILF